eukprot:6482529-Amphidinium_carterae.6
MVTNHYPRPRGYTARSATPTTARPRPVCTGFSTQAAQGSRGAEATQQYCLARDADEESRDQYGALHCECSNL